MDRQMQTSTKRWMGAAAGIAIALAVPQAAQAGAKAYARIDLSNYVFQDITNGGALRVGLAPGPGIDVILFGGPNNNILESVQHSSTRLAGPGAGLDAEGGSDTNIFDGLAVNAPFSCVGPVGVPGCGAVVEDNFAMGDFNNDEYNRADSTISGTGVDTGAGAQARTANMVAEAITQRGANDIAGATYTSTSSFTITPTQNLVLGLTFDYVTTLFAGLHSDARVGSTSNAGVALTFSVTEQATGTSIGIVGNTADFNDDNIANFLPGTVVNGGGAGNIAAQTAVALTANQQYNIRVEFAANARLNAEKIPEPGVLAMLGLGLGLVGVAAARPRRRKA